MKHLKTYENIINISNIKVGDWVVLKQNIDLTSYHSYLLKIPCEIIYIEKTEIKLCDNGERGEIYEFWLDYDNIDSIFDNKKDAEIYIETINYNL